MKKIIVIFTLTGLVIFSGLESYGQQNKKATAARKDIKQANKELTEAKRDSAADYQLFKKEAEIKIADNQLKIAELKAKKSDDNKETKEKYDKKVLALEQRNNELKKKMDGSGAIKTNMWASFKREFSHDMDEFGNAFRDIGVNNAK